MKRAGVFILLFLIGMLVFLVGGYWTGISHGLRTVIKVAVPAVLFLVTFACRRFASLNKWYRISLAFLAASCGFLVSWLVSDPLMRVFGLSTDSVSGLAFAKLFDALPIVAAAYLVARLGGMKNADLYLRKGRVRAWMIVGLIAFAAFIVLFLLQAAGQGIGADRLLAYAPWTLIFIFSNAFMEELHFRGLFLGPFERLMGRHSANLCIALFFTFVHAPVQYTSDIYSFLAILFVLALVWGYIIQKTESLWGSVLFHAGADLLVIVGIYGAYGSA